MRETSERNGKRRLQAPGGGLHDLRALSGKGVSRGPRKSRDWYHEDVPWDPPALIREIDKLIGLRKDALKFSYVVLRKDGLSLTDVHGVDSCRIVSEPLVSKGKIEFYLCGPGGRLRVTRP